MRNGTHELVGVSLALTAGRALDAGPADAAGLVVAAFLGSWLPDVDQLGARVHRRTRLERRSTIIGAIGACLRLPAFAFAAVVPHRGITHSALACLGIAGAAALIASVAGVGVALVARAGVTLGYLAHVLADACTPGGVALWAPFSPRRVWLLPRRARIPTGSRRETALAGAAAVALVITVLA